MEGYILDSLYRRIDVVDQFISFIWTERQKEMGDFVLEVPSTLQNRSRFTPGTNLALDRSFRVMTIETVEDATDDEYRNTLKISGRSLERILDDRVARHLLSDLTAEPKWSLTGLPIDIAELIFHDICTVGSLDPSDIVTGIIEGNTLFPTDTIPSPEDVVTIEIDPTTVYQAIKQIADIYSFGFRIARDPVSGQLYFDVYTGCNRTSQQTLYPSVVFSPSLDNLQKTSELKSNAAYKNVAYVISPVGHEVVYLLDTPSTITGFDRRVLLVKADDITDTDPAIASAKMIQRGKDQLAINTTLTAFDGELNQYSNYKYGIDYNLGDLVEERNVDGVSNQMQVTEQILAEDSEGERSYPTLSLNKFITPGSWSSLGVKPEWVDLEDDPITWSEEP